MTTRTVDLDVELLSGGLGKVTSKCSISGRPKANPEGVALMLGVVTSLFASPPGVATHLLEPAIAVDLTGSGIAGGSDDPVVGAALAADGPEGQSEDDAVSECGSAASVKSFVDDGGEDPDQPLARAAPAAVMADVSLAAAVDDDLRATVLGLALGDERLSE